jgi:alpha-1,6-mannosyltransferase
MAMTPCNSATETIGRPAPRRAEESSSLVVFTVLDVALCYGAGFDGLATYLHAKHAYAERSRAFRHHVIVPAAVERHYGGWHELSLSSSQRHGRRRFSRHPGRLLDLLANIAPDILLLHGSSASERAIVARAHAAGATVIGVPWRGEAAAAQKRVTRRWRSRTLLARLAPVDAVLTSPSGAETPVPRFGVDSVFHPLPGVRRDAHVLFAGELSRSNGVFDLIAAASLISEPLEVRLYGRGEHERAIRRRIASFGLSHRVRVHPYLPDRAVLAEEMARAGCMVVPGPPSRGQLVALEAAATGVPVVACEGSAITRLAPELAHPFPPGDLSGLSAAIRTARVALPNPAAGVRLSRALTWDRVFQCELDHLIELAHSA